MFINGLTTEHTGESNEQAYTEIEIGAQTVKFKIDTGAQINAIPEHKRLFKGVTVKPATQKLTTYGEELLAVKGTCSLLCKHKDNSMMLKFYIVDTKAPPILGMRASLDLSLIKLILAVTGEDKEPDTD